MTESKQISQIVIDTDKITDKCFPLVCDWQKLRTMDNYILPQSTVFTLNVMQRIVQISIGLFITIQYLPLYFLQDFFEKKSNEQISPIHKLFSHIQRWYEKNPFQSHL